MDIDKLKNDNKHKLLTVSEKIGLWFNTFRQTELFKRALAFLFPEFSNKLTWSVALAGISVVVLPAIPILALGFLTNLWNKNFGQTVPIPPVPEISPWFGIGLIGMALLHNLCNRWLIAAAAPVKNPHDLALKAAFLEELPTESGLIQLLKNHDFGHSFPTAPITVMEDFLQKWQGAEFQFHTQSLQEHLLSFRESLCALNKKIALDCGPAYSVNRLTAIPDYAMNEFTWPEEVVTAVESLNETASDAFKRHQELVAMLTKFQ